MQLSAGGIVSEVLFSESEKAFEWGAGVLALVTMIYVMVGGMRSVAWSEVSQGSRLIAGMLIAVEPMIAVGGSEIHTESQRWPIRTRDGSNSVHYEADVLITENGPRDLTEGMDQLPDVVG